MEHAKNFVSQFDKKHNRMVFTEWSMKFVKCLYFYLTIVKPIWKVTLMLFKALSHVGDRRYGSTYWKPRNWVEENGLLQTLTMLFSGKDATPPPSR